MFEDTQHILKSALQLYYSWSYEVFYFQGHELKFDIAPHVIEIDCSNFGVLFLWSQSTCE